MNEENKKNIIFLQNFFNKNKDTPLIIKQPKQTKFYDIFGKEEGKTEKIKRNGSQKLKSVNNSFGVKYKKYNIIKESAIFQEIDTKKSFNNISNFKNNYKNYLYNIIIQNKSLNTTKFNSERNDNFIRQKSTLNINTLYEIKLKNVRS
jgi:hypothetical protein